MEPIFFLKKLMKLSHRGVCTANEKKAAEIIYNEYKKMGFSPKIHKFKTLKNFWILLFLIVSLSILSIIFLLTQKFTLSLFLYFFSVLIWFNLKFISRKLLKKIYLHESQNVFVEILPKKEIRKTIVIFGHYDTAKNSLGIKLIQKIFGKKLKKIIRIQKKLLVLLRGPLSLVNISILMISILFFLSSFPIIKFILSFTIILVLSFFSFFFLHAGFSSAVPGAFDNGSGTAIVMSIAGYFRKNRLNNSKLIFLNNGSEENLTRGFSEFIKFAKIDKKNTIFINLDAVGANNLKACYGETDFFGKSLLYDKNLFSIVENKISENIFKSIEKFYSPMGTDSGELVEMNCNVMTSIISLNDNASIEYYHQRTDTMEKINFKTVGLCKKFVISLVNELEEKWF